MKVVSLSAQSSGCTYPEEIFLVLISVRGCQPQGHSAAGKIVSITNSKDTIGNRTRDLPACSAVPQPTAPPLYGILQARLKCECRALMKCYWWEKWRSWTKGVLLLLCSRETGNTCGLWSSEY